jgi:hypothetical protein
MSWYDTDDGPPDMFGNIIKVDDRIVVGSNDGLRVGEVVGIRVHDLDPYSNGVTQYSYSVTIKRELANGKTRTQTFNHDNMGEKKFWRIP